MSRYILFINPPVLAADRYQVDLYAEAIPYGLLQIAAFHRLCGDRVRFLDMMEYLNEDGFEGVFNPARLWAVKPTGDATCRGRRGLYRLGRSLSWLRERLSEGPAPDEVAVTSCISFNYETTHAVVRVCREVFPRARIRLGGFYPSSYPDHAALSGADEIFVGRHREADEVLPALDLLEQVPPV